MRVVLTLGSRYVTQTARATAQAVVNWSAARGVHLVSDEVYALSHFGAQLHAANGGDGRARAPPTPFVSVGELLRGELGERVHVLWGLSKDFGMSGLRFGVVWTRNAPLRTALCNAR